MHLSDHRIISERYFFPRRDLAPEPRYVEVMVGRLACAQVDHGHDKTLLHFHGNGEVVGDYLPSFPKLMAALGLNTFLAEYRGYGASDGEPKLAEMFEDLPAIQEAAGAPESLLVFGRSIGSIYAIEFVRRYPKVAGLVLESGIADVLERILLRVSPQELGVSIEEMRLAFSDVYDHQSKLAAYGGPCLVLHAEHDHLVHTSHAEQNASWAGGDTRLVILPRGDHNSIFYENQEQYVNELRDFVARAGAALFARLWLIVLRLDKISLRHGHQLLFVEASLAVFTGNKIGLVGPNGSGKSSIFRVIVGEEQTDGGQVVIDKGVTIGYFSQDVGEMRGRTVVEETIAGAGEVADVGRELAAIESAMADPERADELEALIDRFGVVQARFDDLDGYGLDARAREILAGLSVREEQMDADVGTLSGGWKMRVALARILLMQPDLLLLDEPTNHLDIESIIWLERFLQNFAGALIVTSHDRSFLDRLVTHIVEIDGGELTSFKGGCGFYERQRELIDKQSQAQFARQQAMLAKEKAFIERFKARASHAAQVQSREKKLEKIELVEPPRRAKPLEFNFASPPRSSEDVANLKSLDKAYGELEIYQGLDYLIRRGERWCVMGVNGAGKSTLLKLVAGAVEPDAGTVTLGPSVKLGYFAQHAMELLDGSMTIFETLLAAFPRAGQGSLRSLAGGFGFSGDDVDKQCSVLSGGEKARLVLARMLFDPPNFLVLDEPTNHLDMATKTMLVKSLRDFAGTMLFVSHDRQFLAALSNRVIELQSGGHRKYEGGYLEYVEQTGYEAPGVG